MRVATRLAWRVYGQGKRSSRQERIHMRQSLGDLVRVIPLAGLFVVFGLELSTAAILRYMPNLLPRAMRQAIVPAAQKLGVAPTSNAAAAARRRLALCTDLVQGSRAVAEASNLAEAERLLARVEDGAANADAQKVGAGDIRAAAAGFDGTALSLSTMPKALVMQLAELHLPSGLTIPGPASVGDALGSVSASLTPTLVQRRRLREYVNRLRNDDKEILFEGVAQLSGETLRRACEDRGLVRGSGTAVESMLRSRLLSWLELSKDAAVSDSLLLLAPAMLLHDAHSLEEEGGLLMVKVASLRNTAAYYDNRARRYLARLEETRSELARYEELLFREQAKEEVLEDKAKEEVLEDKAKEEVSEDKAKEGEADELLARKRRAARERRAALERLESMLDAEEDVDAADNILKTKTRRPAS